MHAIEETLQRLLNDPNVPADLAKHAVSEALETWKRGNSSRELATFVPTFAERRADSYLLQGPSARFERKRIRVSRVMLARIFQDFYLRMPQFHLQLRHPPGQSMKLRQSQMRSEAYPWVGSRGVTWVGLADEVESRSADDVVDNLGLIEFGAPIAIISYSVASSELRVPTIFDAFSSPYFAAKRDLGEPRAWNWRIQSDGFIELVHGPLVDVALSDIEVRLIGSAEMPPPPSLFSTLKLPVSHHVADAVRFAIRRLESSTSIIAFLDEKSDFLHLSPRQFEEFLGVLFTLRGYETRVTQATRDGGFDVIAVNHNATNELLLLQAKKTSATVGISVIRELAGARHFAGDDYSSGILVVATTGRFSAPARQLEHQHASELRLHDYRQLKAMTEAARGVTVEQIALDALIKARQS